MPVRRPGMCETYFPFVGFRFSQVDRYQSRKQRLLDITFVFNDLHSSGHSRAFRCAAQQANQPTRTEVDYEAPAEEAPEACGLADVVNIHAG